MFKPYSIKMMTLYDDRETEFHPAYINWINSPDGKIVYEEGKVALQKTHGLKLVQTKCHCEEIYIADETDELKWSAFCLEWG